MKYKLVFIGMILWVTLTIAFLTQLVMSWDRAHEQVYVPTYVQQNVEGTWNG